MKKVTSFFAVAIIAASLAFGLPAVNFWGMVIIFLLTIIFALGSAMVTGDSMSDFGGREFAMCIFSAIFGMCALGGLINGYDFPLWVIVVITTVVLWIKPDKCMLPFAAWMTGCSTVFFVQSYLHNGFILETCVTAACVIGFVISTICAFFVKKKDKKQS